MIYLILRRACVGALVALALLLSVRPAAANRLYSSGFELNSLSDNHDCHTVVATGLSLSSTATEVRSGDHALRVNGLTSGAEGSCEFRFAQNPAPGPFYIRAYFRFSAFPGAANRIIELQACCGTVTAYVTVDNAGILRLYDEDGEITAGIGATLTTGGWYRLELRWDSTGSGATDIVKLYVDGAEVLGATNRNLTFSTQSLIVGGNLKLEANAAGDWAIDDVGINDDLGTNNNGETGLPGAGSIVHLYPNAEGDADTDVSMTQPGCTATTRWDCLEEVPFDDGTSYIGFNLNGTSVVYVAAQDFALPAGKQVQFVAVGIRFTAAGTGGGGASHYTLIKSQAGGVLGSALTAFGLATANVWFTHLDDVGLQQYKLTQYMDPQNTAMRWSDSTLDSMQIGAATTDGNPDVNVSALWALVEYEVESEAKVLTGTYQGDGAASHFIDVGFVPDFVIVKGGDDAAGTQGAVFRTATMATDAAKASTGATAVDVSGTWIRSFDTGGGGGFTVGSNERVNRSGVNYYWTAFKAGPGRMEVGSYTGNATAGRVIPGLGFSPDLVYVMSEGAQEPIHRSSASTGAFDFADSGPDTTSVSSLDANGFTVGTESRVNAASTVYHYVAWKEEAGYMDVGTYLGTGADNRNVTTVGFEPEYVFVKKNEQFYSGRQKLASLDQYGDGVGVPDDGRSLFFDTWGYADNNIEEMLTNGFQVGSQVNVNELNDTFLYYAWKRVSQPMILTGGYTGDGAAAQSIGGMGFSPDVVIVKAAYTHTAVIRTSTMPGTNAKEMADTSAWVPSLMQLDGDGFTVSSNDAKVNSSTGCAGACAYYWTAFKASASSMKVGRYQGNGTSVAIAGMGFSPELIFILPEGSQAPVHYSTGNTAEFYGFAAGLGTAASGVIALDADGFTVSTSNASVNANAVWYDYVAWNEIPGDMKVSSYVADNPATQKTIPVGFEPEYVIVKHTNNFHTVQHPASLGRSNDQTLYFNALVQAPADIIEALVPTGFNIGWDFQVNQDAQTYVYYAWRRPSLAAMTAVDLTAFTATRYARGVLVQWRTGYEIDNLGFHVYREVNGERTRVTRSVVAGSGLMAGQSTSVNAEQRYATWDLEASSADPSAVYWLQDLDFNGTSTWHGPVTTVDGGIEAPADVVASGSLGDLAKGQKRRGKIFDDRGARVERPRKSDRTGAPITALQTQWALAAQPAMKIGIDHPGWYRVTQADLAGAGFDVRVDPRTLRLVVDGLEQAITVTGAQDGRFDAADAVEFYGAAIDTPATDTHVYWLVGGGQPGRRMVISGAAGRGQTASAANFSFTAQQKERSIYFAALRNGHAENWFGAFISEEASDLTLQVSNLDAAGDGAEIEIALQGVTAVVGVDPDHTVAVLVNGREVGELRFDGQAIGVQTFAIAPGVLTEGDNTVTIVARGGEADYSLVDIVRLRYPHTYHADGDLLRFTAEGRSPVTVGGFTGRTIRVVDITDPLSPEELRAAVGADGGLSAVTARPQGEGTRTLLAFTDATVATPAFLRPNAVSQWHAASQRADYVAVSHAAFAGAVAPLLARHAQQGLSTALVDIEDVYDEFSFGEKSPQALRDFVMRARASWATKPRFLLLVGDATIDPRDYAGFGDADFVPTKQVPLESVALETASDDWFVDVDDDGLPDVAVGRLPVRTLDQAKGIVAKTIAYEAQAEAPWMNEVLFVADDDEDATGHSFDTASRRLEALVPETYRSHELFSSQLDADALRQRLAAQVADGRLIVNYSGHGSTQLWGVHGNLLGPDDVNGWRNARLPFVVAMNCLNGLFQGIYDEESLAETLLRAPQGGAVAVWASSGITDTARQAVVAQELYRLIFQGNGATLGEVVAAAKRVAAGDVRRSWIFFGDPALRLKGIRPADAAAALSAPVVLAARTDSDPSVTTDAAPDGTPGEPARIVRLADLTGDGRDDRLFYDGERGTWTLAFSDTGELPAVAGRWDAGLHVTAARLNGDAAADLVFYRSTTGEWTEAVNAGRGTFIVRASGTGVPDQQLLLADVTGDGRDDRLMYDPRTGTVVVTTHDQSGDVTEARRTWPAGARLHAGDFNGDGFADLAGYDAATGRGFVALRTRADFVVIDTSWGAGWTVTPARLSDRRRSDLVFYDPKTGAARVATSDGRGGFTSEARTWPAGLALQAADLEGDGRDDLFGYSPHSGVWWTAAFSSRGVSESIGQWTLGWHAATGDLNGDGRSDVLLYDPLSGLGFRFHTVTPGVFDYRPETWTPGATLIGRQ
jgi:hypothetical protein